MIAMYNWQILAKRAADESLKARLKEFISNNLGVILGFLVGAGGGGATGYALAPKGRKTLYTLGGALGGGAAGAGAGYFASQFFGGSPAFAEESTPEPSEHDKRDVYLSQLQNVLDDAERKINEISKGGNPKEMASRLDDVAAMLNRADNLTLQLNMRGRAPANLENRLDSLRDQLKGLSEYVY